MRFIILLKTTFLNETTSIHLKTIFCLNMKGELGVGNGPTFRCKAFRNLDKKTFGTVSINSSMQQHRLSAGLQASKSFSYVFTSHFLVSYSVPTQYDLRCI